MPRLVTFTPLAVSPAASDPTDSDQADQLEEKDEHHPEDARASGATGATVGADQHPQHPRQRRHTIDCQQRSGCGSAVEVDGKGDNQQAGHEKKQKELLELRECAGHQGCISQLASQARRPTATGCEED